MIVSSTGASLALLNTKKIKDDKQRREGEGGAAQLLPGKHRGEATRQPGVPPQAQGTL